MKKISILLLTVHIRKEYQSKQYLASMWLAPGDVIGKGDGISK